MAERMVQVPASLAWQVEGLLRTSDDRYYREIGRTLASVLRTQPTPSTEPLRIEDMAPGTTFWARTQDGSLSHADRFWIVTDSGYVFSTGAHHLMSNRIDPSTIRDVTQPKEQP